MKKTIITVIWLLIATSLHAQEIEWQNSIGGNGWDILKSVKHTTDNGFILGGWSTSNISGDKTEPYIGSADYWIVKTDSSGNIQWQNTIGGNAGEQLNAIEQTSDGGYILGGSSASGISGDKTENPITYTGSPPGYVLDYWIVKTDSLGNIQWQNTIGGNERDELTSIKQTADGGYIIGGQSESNISGDKTENSYGEYDFWIVKTDSSGNIQWQETIGGSYYEVLSSVCLTLDGGYILGGWSGSPISGNKTENSNGGLDYWIVKISSSGNIQWQKTYGGNDHDYLFSLQQTDDGGFFLGGYSWSNISGNKTENTIGTLGRTDFWIIKTDSIGNMQWQNTIGGNNDDWLNSVLQTNDHGYLLSGYSLSHFSGDKTEHSFGKRDFWVVKTDAAGQIQWQNNIGGTGIDDLFSIDQVSDGNYILGGQSSSNISGDKTENCIGGNSDYWIIKLTDRYSSITGKCFIDINSSGIMDSNEITLRNKKVTESNTGRTAFADNQGAYALNLLDTGNYIVVMDSIPYYHLVPAMHSGYFPVIQLKDSLKDFAYQPASNINDLKISITPVTAFRSGFNADYSIHYENVGTTTLIASVVFYLNDSNYTYVSSSITPTIISSDSLAWNNILLSPFQTGDITITVNVNTGILPGTQLNTLCLIEPQAGDATPGDNYGSWKVFTTGSFDPNDILVDKDSIPLLQLASQPFLEYIIRFQNTGNDTCFNAKIINLIDTNKLQLNSFEFVASSHPLIIKRIPWQSNIEFKFDNILLPDSNVNEQSSHGFVRYRIEPKTNLFGKDYIVNYASIYFDFNDPVLTNKAITYIVCPAPPLTHIYITACDSYYWPLKKKTYTTSGVYQKRMQGVLHCDSLIRLHLTINNSSAEQDTNISACEEYYWQQTGQTYTSSGVYSDTLTNAVGCDSIVTIILTLNKSYSTINVAACDNYTSPSGNYIYTTSGIYQDTIQNVAGCDSIITIHLTINTVDTSVTANAPFLSANAAGAAYQWMYCDSGLIAGATNQSYTATTNGYYAVIIFQNGCVDTSSCYSVFNVGIIENENQSALKVFPDPAKNTITISCSGCSEIKGKLLITDIYGRTVYTSIPIERGKKDFALTIDVSRFASGIYFIQSETSQSMARIKFVKE